MTNLKINQLQNITMKPFHLCTKSLQLANHFILTISSPHTTHFPHYLFPCSRRIKHSTKLALQISCQDFLLAARKHKSLWRNQKEPSEFIDIQIWIEKSNPMEIFWDFIFQNLILCFFALLSILNAICMENYNKPIA